MPITSQTIQLQLLVDWNQSAGRSGKYSFYNIVVTDGNDTMYGDDPEGREVWRISIADPSSTTPPYNPTFLLLLKLYGSDLPTSGNVTGELKFKAMNTAPLLTAQTKDPFGNALPSKYDLSATLSDTSSYPITLSPAVTRVTTGGDWAWKVELNIPAGNTTRKYVVDPEMEVGDLGSPG